MRHLPYLLSAYLLTGCGQATPVVDAALSPPASGPQTAQVTLVHGSGFVCTVRDLLVYCWASEAAAVSNGDAAWLGLTSVVPKLIHTSPLGTVTTLIPYDHGIQVIQNGSLFGYGNTAAQTTATYSETVTCNVVSPAELLCPEATPSLLFTRRDLHSPTYVKVRHTAERESHKTPICALRPGRAEGGLTFSASEAI